MPPRHRIWRYGYYQTVTNEEYANHLEKTLTEQRGILTRNEIRLLKTIARVAKLETQLKELRKPPSISPIKD